MGTVNNKKGVSNMNKDELTKEEKTTFNRYIKMLLELPKDQYEKHKRAILSGKESTRLAISLLEELEHRGLV